MEETKIDFVVTWLDSTDPKWQKQYEYYRDKLLTFKEKEA